MSNDYCSFDILGLICFNIDKHFDGTYELMGIVIYNSYMFCFYESWGRICMYNYPCI